MAMMGHFFTTWWTGKRQWLASLKMQDKQKPSPRRVWRKPRTLEAAVLMEKTLNQTFGSGRPSTTFPSMEPHPGDFLESLQEAHQDGDHLTNLHRLAGPQARLGGYQL